MTSFTEGCRSNKDRNRSAAFKDHLKRFTRQGYCEGALEQLDLHLRIGEKMRV